MNPEIYCTHTETRDPESLVEHPRNINQHPKEQIELLAKIIKYQGWRNSIVISERSGFVVKGHGRLAAALLLGCEQVPVDVQEYKDEASEVADMLADNRIAELSETPEDEIKKILADDVFDGFDIELTGFNASIFNDDEIDVEEEKPEIEFSPELNEAHNYVVLYFDNEIDWLAAQTHFDLSSVYSKRSNGKPWSKGIGRVIDGGEYISNIK